MFSLEKMKERVLVLMKSNNRLQEEKKILIEKNRKLEKTIQAIKVKNNKALDKTYALMNNLQQQLGE